MIHRKTRLCGEAALRRDLACRMGVARLPTAHRIRTTSPGAEATLRRQIFDPLGSRNRNWTSMAFGSKIVRRLTQGLQQGGSHRATELGELDVAIYVRITAVAARTDERCWLQWTPSPEQSGRRRGQCSWWGCVKGQCEGCRNAPLQSHPRHVS